MPVPLTARILLADDHELVRGGLKLVLESAPDLRVVAEAGDGAEALELALREDIDLAVLDVSLPRLRAAVRLYARPDRPPGRGRDRPAAAGAAHADALRPRLRAVLLRGAQGGG